MYYVSWRPFMMALYASRRHLGLRRGDGPGDSLSAWSIGGSASKRPAALLEETATYSILRSVRGDERTVALRDREAPEIQSAHLHTHPTERESATAMLWRAAAFRGAPPKSLAQRGSIMKIGDHRTAWPHLALMLAGLLMLTGLLMPAGGAANSADQRGWLGIYTEPVPNLPDITPAAGGPAALDGALCGLRVTAVFPFSPAEKGGLLAGDIIVAAGDSRFDCPVDSAQARFLRSLENGTVGQIYPVRVLRDAIETQVECNGATLPAASARRFWHEPLALVDSLTSGDTLRARASKQQAIVTLPITLGPRPEAHWPPAPSNADIYPPTQLRESRFTSLVWELSAAFGIRSDTEDLLRRLARCQQHRDPFRLDCMTYGHRDPFRFEHLSEAIVDSLGQAHGIVDLLARAAALWIPEHSLAMPRSRRLVAPEIPAPAGAGRSGPQIAAGDPLEDPSSRLARMQPLLDQIVQVLSEARIWHTQAFRELTEEELDFLASQRWELTELFAKEIYIHFDDDRDRFERNYRLIKLAEKVDYGALMESALRVALLTDLEWVRSAAGYVREVFSDTLQAAVLLEYDSPMGGLVFGGRGSHWYAADNIAFIMDLGGDDFYSAGSGDGSDRATPLTVCIDLEGDDAYETTEWGRQGSGCLGIGGLLDLEGDDQYIGMQWAQGTGYLGIGWLHDLEGDDTYRGHSFCQGVGLFGLGLLLDEQGDDQFMGDSHVQAVGLAKGIGLLHDAAGDDRYFAKGRYPTGYGTSGIFEAWSQGCGMGFRTLASGGLGVLLDGGGTDRMEAGNFSQGGGYYYGYGILHAAGPEDDRYIGSRYNQGFSAHQALGYFHEAGGDDHYVTRNGVAQGLAWDESVTLFVDAAGNDHYQGGRFFSHGASAHNSVCVFMDQAGRDRYDYLPGPARAGGNSYHGGTSLSLFIDEGGQEDFYGSVKAHNGRAFWHPEYGFFIDCAGSLQQVRPEQFAPTPD